MLLRRVIEHVKAQNWFAVALDFAIVVIGVFVGLQVSNWNDARRERMEEKIYLQRLHDEAEAGLDGPVGWVEAYFEPRVALFRDAIKILAQSDGDAEALTDEHCDVIGNMHDFIAVPFQFPSLEELAASGKLGVIREPALRDALIRYRLMQDQSKSLIGNINTELVVLPNEFPTYFDAVVTLGPAGRDLIYRNCATAAMQSDKRFLNLFADMASRYNQYHSIVVEREAQMMRNLHAKLDEALNIAHEEAGE